MKSEKPGPNCLSEIRFDPFYPFYQEYLGARD